MTKRQVGIPKAIARYAATVFGAVIVLISMGSNAFAGPVIDPSIIAQIDPTQSLNKGEIVDASVDAVASQVAGIIDSTIKPVAVIFNSQPVINQISKNPNSEDARDVNCVAQAIYYEARGEPERGQLAVAEVVLNRVNSRAYPSTFCGVTHQRTGKICQFSWACDARRSAPRGPQWEKANIIAQRVVGGWKPDVVGKATHFHATFVHPSWANVLPRVAKIGTHIFYRQ